MTTQEIKALVAAKIAGQGNQVDLGNALSDIFGSLCDLIDAAQQLPIATKDALGVIKVGDNLDIDSEGKLSASGGESTLILVGDLEENESSEVYIKFRDDYNYEAVKTLFKGGTRIVIHVDESWATVVGCEDGQGYLVLSNQLSNGTLTVSEEWYNHEPAA